MKAVWSPTYEQFEFPHLHPLRHTNSGGIETVLSVGALRAPDIRQAGQS